jgi:hypothetical protein
MRALHQALFVAHMVQYAVRGELYNKALELQKQGRDLIFTNGGAIRVD